ncbi:MAG: hypothetical protein RIM99_12150 [Cyclobacteriaceae bacterium]
MKINFFFKKGFNHGYILSKENPKYLKELLKSIRNKHQQYTIGLQAAKDQFLDKDKGQDTDKSKGLER